jgi:hypothetical protein
MSYGAREKAAAQQVLQQGRAEGLAANGVQISTVNLEEG